MQKTSHNIVRHIVTKPLFIAMTAALMSTTAYASAPPAGSLPGAFSSSTTAGYAAGSSSSAGIVSYSASGAVVMQWGGAVDTTSVNPVSAPAGITSNAGLDIGSGASLTIQNTDNATSSVLLSDVTGNASQIDGTLTAEGAASGDPAPTLFVANANGVVVGSSGDIIAPSGFGMVGYAQDPAAFVAAAGDVTVNSATSTNHGVVSVDPGANLSGVGTFMLVSGGGDVNMGEATPATAPLSIVDGLGFTDTPAGSFTPNTTIPIQGNAIANLVLNGGTSSDPITANLAASAGNFTVDNGAYVDLPNGLKNVGETNVNNGNVTIGVTGAYEGDTGVTNNGVLTFAVAGENGMQASTGNVNNNGVINLVQTTGNKLYFDVPNNGDVNLKGIINQGGSAISASNPLSGVNAYANGASGSNNGILNIGTFLYSADTTTGTSGVFGDEFNGNVIRFLSGSGYRNVASAGILNIYTGGGKWDGFGYNLSLFPGSSVTAPTINVYGPTSTHGNINLDGVMTGSSINITGADTINSNFNSGGFAVNQGGTLNVSFSGNLNNPNGSAQNGQPGQYLDNGLTVNMLGTGGSIILNPSNTASGAQMVNLLVNGNATLGTSGLTNPLSAGVVAPQATYPNSHYLVEDNGNITLSSGFYWPGLMMLQNSLSMTSPSAIGTGTITLDGPVSNVIPTDVSGNAGIFFMTNQALVGVSSTNTVTTNTNSWINFPLSSGLAQSYGTINPGFYGASVVSGGNLGTSILSSNSINASSS